MTITGALADESPLTVRQAAQELRDARRRMDTYKLEYAAARDSYRPAVITRARSVYGLAVYELVECLVACAKAEDRQRLAEEPATALGDEQADPLADQPPTRGTLAQARAWRDDCWQAYQHARRTGDATAMAAARADWTQALSAWMRAQLAGLEAEDRAKIRGMQGRQDAALTFRPLDAFPGSSGRAADLAANSREHARREALRRDRERYQGR